MRPARESDVFDAIAHPVRRRILQLLKDGERPAGELAAPFQISLAAVAQHLKVLREAALVQQQRRGRQLIYYLNPEPLRALYEWLDELGHFWNGKLDALERHLDQKYPPAPKGATRAAKPRRQE